MNDLSVILRREQTEGRCMQSEDVRGANRTVRLNIEKAMEIRRLTRLKSFVGDIYKLI